MADIGYFEPLPLDRAENMQQKDYETLQGNTYWHNVHLFLNQAKSIAEFKNIDFVKHLHECLQEPAQQWYIGELDQSECQLLSSNMVI